MVSEATHLAGGRIDQAWCNYTGGPVEVDVKLYSPYYTCKDHDALLFTTYEKTSEEPQVDDDHVPADHVRNHTIPLRKRKPKQGRRT